jgi:hypothetical protein
MGDPRAARELSDGSILVLDENGRVLTRLAARTPRASAFLRSDSDQDGRATLTDAIFTLQHLFQSGPAPPCAKSADADDSGALDLTDAVHLLQHLFQGGAAPPAPYPECGPDPTADDLTCESSACP